MLFSFTVDETANTILLGPDDEPRFAILAEESKFVRRRSQTTVVRYGTVGPPAYSATPDVSPASPSSSIVVGKISYHSFGGDTVTVRGRPVYLTNSPNNQRTSFLASNGRAYLWKSVIDGVQLLTGSHGSVARTVAIFHTYSRDFARSRQPATLTINDGDFPGALNILDEIVTTWSFVEEERRRRRRSGKDKAYVIGASLTDAQVVPPQRPDPVAHAEALATTDVSSPAAMPPSYGAPAW